MQQEKAGRNESKLGPVIVGESEQGRFKTGRQAALSDVFDQRG